MLKPMPYRKHEPAISMPALALIALFAIGITATIVYVSMHRIRDLEVLEKAGPQPQHEWEVFTSRRTAFSFRHPKSWPVARASDSAISQYNDEDSDGVHEIENIDFKEKWDRTSRENKLGYITVERIDGISTLDEYESRIRSEYGRLQSDTGAPQPTPYYKNVTVGGQPGIQVMLAEEASETVTPDIHDIRVVKNGLVYRFVTISSDRYLRNREENDEVFEGILESVTFK